PGCHGWYRHRRNRDWPADHRCRRPGAPTPDRLGSMNRSSTSKRLLFNANVAWFFISHRLAIAQAARDAGYEVHVSADVESEDEAATIAQEGVAFHRVTLRRGGLNPVGDLGYVARLGSIVRRVKPDLIHNISVKPVIYGSVVARALGVRRIVNAISG